MNRINFKKKNGIKDRKVNIEKGVCIIDEIRIIHEELDFVIKKSGPPCHEI